MRKIKRKSRRPSALSQLRVKKRFRFSKGDYREIDYKDVKLLSEYISESGKIMPRRLTGANAIVQSKLANAIKLARYLALLPYTDKQ